MSSHSTRRRSALTLIEVVVSLVLAAVVITALVRAHAHSIEQLHATQRVHVATRLAHNLLAEWSLHRPGSIRTMGMFDATPDWSWRRTVHVTDIIDNAHVRRVDVDIVHARPGQPPEIITTLSWLENNATDSAPDN